MNTKTVHNCEKLSEDEKMRLVNEAMKDYAYQENNLIQILHIAQTVYGYLPVELQQHIATEMKLPLSKVSGVVSFYALFSTEKKGEYIVKVCLGTACYVRGGKKIIAKLKKLLDIELGETTEDGKFTLEMTRCIGACGLAPAIAINDDVHMQVNPDKLLDILERYE